MAGLGNPFGIEEDRAMTARRNTLAAVAVALAVAALAVGGEAEARKGNRGVERVSTSYHEEHWGDWSVTTYRDGQEIYEGGGYRTSYDSYDTWSR